MSTIPSSDLYNGLEYFLWTKDRLHLPILFLLQIFMAGPFYMSEEGHNKSSALSNKPAEKNLGNVNRSNTYDFRAYNFKLFF